LNGDVVNFIFVQEFLNTFDTRVGSDTVSDSLRDNVEGITEFCKDTDNSESNWGSQFFTFDLCKREERDQGYKNGRTKKNM
jgi:hypothetical protein